MDDELVLLTSYFNLAGGRRQDTADTFRVESSLPSTAGLDDTAALYVVTESSATGQMGPRARRQAADVVAWEYASHGDEQPAHRLKAGLRTAHDAILKEFDSHVTVGLSVMAVEQDTVYLGQVAPAQVYVLHEGSLHSIPARAGGDSPFGRALGSTAGPRISVFRDQIGPEDVVALCSSWFQQGADPDELRECFTGESADEIAERMLELAKRHDVRDATAIVIEAVTAGQLEREMAEDEPAGFMDQVDAAVRALADVGKMLWQELQVHPSEVGTNGQDGSAAIDELEPTAEMPGAGASVRGEERRGAVPVESGEVRVAEPGEPEIAPQLQAEESYDPGDMREERAPEQATEEVPIVPPPSRELTLEAAEAGAHAVPEPVVVEREERVAEPEVRVESRKERQPEPMSEIEQVNSRLQSSQDMSGVIPPVQAFPEASTEPERIYATSKDIQAVNKRPRRFGGASPTPAVIRPPLGELDLSRPVGRPAPPAVIWFGIAIVFLLAAGSLYLFLKHRHTPVADPYPRLVQRDISLARSQKSATQQDYYLAKARSNLALARVYGATPAQIKSLKVKLRNTTDLLHHITRETDPVLLSDFARYPGAHPTELATAPGSVLVLDAGRKSVFSVTPSSSSNPSLVVQQGNLISGFTIGTPQQIATDGSTILVLDNNHVLVRDTGSSSTATSLTEGTQNENIVSMATADPDVYVLDNGGSQVWRYPAAVSFFNPAPSAFFTPSAPNLKAGVSLALDGTDLYILKNDGTVLKFAILDASPQRFSMNLATPPRNPVAFATGHGLNWVWIADPAHGRILQVDKTGAYARTYVSGTSSMPFGQIKSMAVGPAGNTLYVLCGSKLFDFPVVH